MMASRHLNIEELKTVEFLVNEKYYQGEISSNGFLIKRNFGVRRLVIEGVKNQSGKIEIAVRNEFFHQILYISGMVIIGILAVFMMLQGEYIWSLISVVIALLLWLSNSYQKNKELETLMHYIREYSDQTDDK